MQLLKHYAQNKGLPLDFLRGLGLHQHEEAVAIPYYTPSGQIFRVRFRQGNKRWWGEGEGLIPYGLDRLASYKKDDLFFVAEGESDTQTHWFHGFSALGVPGSDTFKPEWAEYVKKFPRVYLCQDNDEEGGATFVEKTAQGLKEGRYKGRIYLIQMPEGIKDINELHQADPGTFRSRFLELVEKAEIWFGSTRKEPDETERERQQKESQVGKLLKLADGIDFFHDSQKRAWATVPVGSHFETYPVRKGKQFRLWLQHHFYAIHGKAPATQAVQDALETLEGKAIFDGPERQVFVRIAEHGGAVYIDLGNEAWNAVEITIAGWRVIANPPVKFYRPKGLLALPMPADGRSLGTLSEFINFGSEEDFILMVGWLVGTLNPVGPYPIQAIEGEQGAGKSTACRMLKSLVDPNAGELRRPPRDERDLFIAAYNSWLVAFDNFSGLPDWLSDGLCTLATSGAFVTRELYSDSDEVFLRAMRPILINGIDEIGTRSDFRDRLIRVVLPKIEEEATLDERTLWARFRQVQPALFGALLNAVSEALRNWDKVKLERTPRMADFARWVIAAEPVLPWKPGAFLTAYLGQRDTLAKDAIEDNPLAQVILNVVTDDGWEGTATKLLEELNQRVDESEQKKKTWPTTARTLARKLRRLAPDLRKAARLNVEFYREGSKRARIIRIEEVGNPSSVSSLSSTGNEKSYKYGVLGSLSADDTRTQTERADDADDKKHTCSILKGWPDFSEDSEGSEDEEAITQKLFEETVVDDGDLADFTELVF